MPIAQIHIKQAKHNRDLIEALDPTSPLFTDWIVTAAFYVAVHLIEAWFANKNKHFRTHTERDEWGGKVAEFRRVVWPNYKELERHSRNARYECVKFQPNFVQSDILPLVDIIEQEITELLSKQIP